MRSRQLARNQADRYARFPGRPPILILVDVATALPDQMRQIKAVLESAPQALSADQVATAFRGARRKTVQGLLSTLVVVGQAREAGNDRFAAR